MSFEKAEDMPTNHGGGRFVGAAAPSAVAGAQQTSDSRVRKERSNEGRAAPSDSSRTISGGFQRCSSSPAKHHATVYSTSPFLASSKPAVTDFTNVASIGR